MSTTKRVVKKAHMIVDGDMSASIASHVIEATGLDIIAIEVAWDSGSIPSGGVRIEGSATGNTWGVLSTVVSVSNSTGEGFACSSAFNAFSVERNAFSKIRVFYNRVAGSGNLNVWLCAKEA